jgi:hypothetical protein
VNVESAKKRTSAKGKKRISKAEFIKRFTRLTIQHLSTLSPGEQEKRVSAAERRLRISETHPKPSYTEGTRAMHLEAQSRHE